MKITTRYVTTDCCIYSYHNKDNIKGSWVFSQQLQCLDNVQNEIKDLLGNVTNCLFEYTEKRVVGKEELKRYKDRDHFNPKCYQKSVV